MRYHHNHSKNRGNGGVIVSTFYSSEINGLLNCITICFKLRCWLLFWTLVLCWLWFSRCVFLQVELILLNFPINKKENHFLKGKKVYKKKEVKEQ